MSFACVAVSMLAFAWDWFAFSASHLVTTAAACTGALTFVAVSIWAVAFDRILFAVIFTINCFAAISSIAFFAHFFSNVRVVASVGVPVSGSVAARAWLVCWDAFKAVSTERVARVA